MVDTLNELYKSQETTLFSRSANEDNETDTLSISVSSISNNRIMFVWDWDKTLTEEDSQEPMFRANLDRLDDYYYNKYKTHINTPADYWTMLQSRFSHDDGFDNEITYLQNILEDIRNKRLVGRNGKHVDSNELKYFGSQIQLAPGMIEFVKKIKHDWIKQGIEVIMVIVSVGMKNLIDGCLEANNIVDCFDKIYACELVSMNDSPYVNWIKRHICSFSKTKAIIECAKGSGDVNELVPHHLYKVKYRNTFFIDDGMSGRSGFGYLRKKGGKAIGVYTKGDAKAYNKGISHIVASIDALLPRDYTNGSRTSHCIYKLVSEVISPSRCLFPPELIHMTIKGTIEDSDVEKLVKTHCANCNQCLLGYRPILIPPRLF